MQLEMLDWAIIAAFFIISVGLGLFASRSSGKSFSDYFLAGGKMSWWMLGLSMVATTFAADTPGLVTQFVREQGVSANWSWWAFLLTGMLTTFIYAKLWKRTGVKTDLEFCELRYSGEPAAWLRGFRAIYLGVVFNCIAMATVMLAGIKIAGVMLALAPWQTVLIAGSVTLVYTLLGGLRGVILTDCFQFVVALIGAIAAAVVICDLPEVGGFENLIKQPEVISQMSILPDFGNTDLVISLLVIPLAVQWWSVWYPGAEPGGGGYVAQRMLSAKSEADATLATLAFNIMHYAVRPWPWIVVGLASIMVFPTLESLREAYPNLPSEQIKFDLAYPAMLSKLPTGLLGVVVASLIAAFMSTISTHLNWGGSYLTHDYYRRFHNPDATDRQLVSCGRWMTVGLMILSSILALYLQSALDAFKIIMQIGAGTGLIYILRWFWWRINAFTEIAGMIASFVIAIFMTLVYPRLGLGELADWQTLVIGVGLTTVCWYVVTMLTRPTDAKRLQAFYELVRPEGPGWTQVRESMPIAEKAGGGSSTILPGLVAMGAATILVYAILFGTGYFLYGQWTFVAVSALVAALGGGVLASVWRKIA